jgi:hypothetical protein
VTEVASAREPFTPALLDLPALATEDWKALRSEEAPVERPAPRGRRWGALAAAASFIVVVASIGIPDWYARLLVDASAIAAILPSSPSPALSEPATVRPRVDAASLSFEPSGGAAASGAPAQGRQLHDPGRRFTTGERAQRVVQELRNEGYAADGVEVDGGPARGRFVQVKISGYTSATEVERALQRIRELPGGYADARVSESD